MAAFLPFVVEVYKYPPSISCIEVLDAAAGEAVAKAEGVIEKIIHKASRALINFFRKTSLSVFVSGYPSEPSDKDDPYENNSIKLKGGQLEIW